MKNTTLSKLTIFVGLSFLACDTGDTGESSCIPGQEAACTCENGAEGSQTCGDPGDSFNECVCEEVSPDTACIEGELDVCACDEESFGMRECGEDEAFGECLCESGTTGGGNDIPHTQWVLRDKDGEVVNAMFEPVCSGDDAQLCYEEADQKNFPCMDVSYLDSNPIWLKFATKTGEAFECYEDSKDWGTISPPVAFLNPECSGDKYSTDSFGFLANSEPVRIGNNLFEALPETREVYEGEISFLVNGNCEVQPWEHNVYLITPMGSRQQLFKDGAAYSMTLE